MSLGVHLVGDAHMGRFDDAVVITNDSVLTEPLPIVVQDAKRPLMLLSPKQNLRRVCVSWQHMFAIYKVIWVQLSSLIRGWIKTG